MRSKQHLFMLCPRFRLLSSVRGARGLRNSFCLAWMWGHSKRVLLLIKSIWCSIRENADQSLIKPVDHPRNKPFCSADVSTIKYLHTI